MTNRISTAYQQFSQQIQRQSEPTASRKVITKNVIQPSKESPVQQPDKSSRLSQTQKVQLKQLRETGTLENLRSILSEDEESLLGKLFPERWNGYSGSGKNLPVQSSLENIKGGFYDQKV